VINAVLVDRIKDRPPAAGLFIEGVPDQSVRPLRIGIKERPEQGAGKRHMAIDAKALGSLCSEMELFDGAQACRLSRLPRVSGVANESAGWS
jgi:hypothetical protein